MSSFEASERAECNKDILLTSAKTTPEFPNNLCYIWTNQAELATQEFGLFSHQTDHVYHYILFDSQPAHNQLPSLCILGRRYATPSNKHHRHLYLTLRV